MIIRDIYKEIEQHLEKKLVTVITGMRRVGKTTVVKYLFHKIKSGNKIYLDLEKVENRYIFQQVFYKDVEISLQIEGIDFSKKAYILLDEIQLVPEITSVIKYLYDTYPVKFIVTGSSSFFLKNHFSESLSGRKKIFEIFPLSFSEYLQFRKIKADFTLFENTKQTNLSIPAKFNKHFLDYVQYGGFPEVVLTNDLNERKDYLKDIVNSFIETEIKLLADFTKTKELYMLLRLLAPRLGSKVDFSKLAGITGINRHKISDYIYLLEASYMIRLISPFVKNADREIAKQNKIYFTDTGIASVLGNVNTGQLLENVIASHLFQKGSLNYYCTKQGQEIDFVLNGKTAYKVKETPTPQDLQILSRRAISIGTHDFSLIGLNMPASKFDNFIWAGNI